MKLIKSDLENLKSNIEKEGHYFGAQYETLARANDVSIDASQNASNIFELNEYDKIRHKLKETQKERDNYQKQIIGVKSLFNDKISNESLKEMIEQINLRSQHLEITNSEIIYKLDKIKEEKDKFENMWINLEKQKTKILEQNSWLEKELENAKQNIVGTDANPSKLESLQQEITTYKSKCDGLLKQKSDKINELEKEMNQLFKDKELLQLEFVKMQKSKDTLIYELESKIKNKDLLALSSSTLNEIKQIKNKPKGNNAESNKSKTKKKNKDTKYHSDTEEVMDFPSKRLAKDSKKSKISDLKEKIEFLDQEVISKDKQLNELAIENDHLKQELDNNYQLFKTNKLELERNLESVENELKQIKLKYERLLLDQDIDAKSDSEQLIKIKDEHAKLRVENDWLIKEVKKIKTHGFDGQSSVMRMLDDIESTKKELETQYQKEIYDLQQARNNDKLRYEEKVNVLNQNLINLDERNKELLNHLEDFKLKFERIDIEISNKNLKKFLTLIFNILKLLIIFEMRTQFIFGIH